MTELVSVIIPIYNVEMYLERCIDTVINQTYSNLEIILVDDGSPDNCPQICERYKLTDDRIKVIHKANGGLSDARNAGIEQATGKYIIFIDSDDYVEKEMIEKLYLSIVSNEADVAIAGYEPTSGIVYEQCDGSVYADTSEKVLFQLLSRYGWNACGKLVKKESLGSLRFKKGILYEDYEFIPRLFLNSQKAVLINENLYHYFIRQDSIMGQSKSRISDDYITIANGNIELFHKKIADNFMKDQFISWVYIRYYRATIRYYRKPYRENNREFVCHSKKFLKSKIYEIWKLGCLPLKYKMALTRMCMC